MNLITKYKIKKYINSISLLNGTNNKELLDLSKELKAIGSICVPKLIETLSEDRVPEVIYNLLIEFVSNDSLHVYIKALSSPNPKIVSEITNILKGSKSYNPNSLLEVFIDTNTSQAALIKILEHHKHRLTAQAIQGLLIKMDKENRTSILRLVERIATENIVPELIPWTQNDDWIIRLSTAKILSRFCEHQVGIVLIKLLEDPHKSVRQTALESLAKLENLQTVEPIFKLMRDPELTIQSKAIEIIIKKNSPITMPYLLDLLQDESEYVRRGAVEVLNATADASAIKNLLQALRDKDWWVRIRAADALGTIGGPAVVDAVLELIKDKDPFIRRTAVEILNTTCDERTFSALIEATNDEDWWVRERAIDALAKLGDIRAVSILLSLIGKDNETSRVVIRALATLGDPQAIQPILNMVRSSDPSIAKEALQALTALANESNAAEVQRKIFEAREDIHQSISNFADLTLKALIQNFGDHVEYRKELKSNTDIYVSQPPDIRQSLTGSTNISSNKGLLNSSNSVRKSGMNLAEVTIDIESIEAGQILQDRYRFIRRVGKGAFGTALLVEDTAVKEQIVLKFLHAQLAATDQLVKRFVRELRYARKITHENVIRIYDFLTFGRSYAISMEYFESHALSAYLQSNVSIPRRTTLKLVQSICSGMHAAHQVGVIHRDLKPANILVNKESILKIVDFGLASAVSQEDSRVTRSGAMVGTPAYMSPEQIRGEDLDPRTDVYSLGIIMYELFTGQLPYTGKDAISVIYQHVQGHATPPREICPNINPALEAVIVKAMAVDKQNRFQSMEALYMGLNQVKVV